jgi:uncharacterized protein
MNRSIPSLPELEGLAVKTEKANKSFFARLKKKKPSWLDANVRQLHDEAFERIDCLECANCCKTISPTLYDRDIERLARSTRMKSSEFIDQYLYVDEDGDYVFKTTPCPFLDAENYCIVYEDRPKACREYPHTDRDRFYQILDLTLRNARTCPAVHVIVEELRLARG